MSNLFFLRYPYFWIFLCIAIIAGGLVSYVMTDYKIVIGMIYAGLIYCTVDRLIARIYTKSWLGVPD